MREWLIQHARSGLAVAGLCGLTLLANAAPEGAPLLPVACELRTTAYLYPGQTIPGTTTTAESLGWAETPAPQAGKPVLREDGLFAQPVMTHFWNDQNKRLEFDLDLGEACRLDRVEVWVAGGREHGNRIKSVTVEYGTRKVQERLWDGSATLPNPLAPEVAAAADDYAWVSTPIGKSAQFIHVRCESDAPMMKIGGIRVLGFANGDPAQPSAVATVAPPGTCRLEAEALEGAFGPENNRYVGGKAVWLRAPEAELVLPTPGPYVVWFRAFVNGDNQLALTLNDDAQEWTATAINSGNWTRVKKTVAGPAVKLALAGQGAPLLDGLLFVPATAAFDPNRLPGVAAIVELPEVRPQPGFAQKLLTEKGPDWPLTEWLQAILTHYEFAPIAAPSPVTDALGNVLYRGRPFFSLAMFHCTVNDQRLRDAALNTYFAAAGDPEMRKADLAGIVAYHAEWRSYDAIAKRLKRNRSDGQTLLHYICDEPENVGVTATELNRLNALVKACDPEKPTFINVSPGMVSNRAVLSIPDVIGLDQYPIPGGRIADIGFSIDQARISSGGKPVIFIVQSFSWGGYGRDGSRFPTPAEVRAMSMVALVHQARGLWFYEFPAPMGTADSLAEKQPALWADMKALFREIRTLEAVLTGPEVRFPGQLTVPEGARAPEFRLAVNVDRDTAKLLAVNPWDTPVTVTLDLANGALAAADLAPAFSAGVTVAREDQARFRVSFAPLGTAVLAVNSPRLEQLEALERSQALQELTEKLARGISRPQIQVPWLESPTWNQAADLLNSWQSTNRPDLIKLFADRDGLHLQVSARFPKDQKSKCLKRDGQVWADPCIELFFGGVNATGYAQLAVNTANIQYDQRVETTRGDAADHSVDYVWQSTVTAGQEIGDYTVLIPWDSLRAMTGAQPGDSIGFNVASSLSKWDWAGLTGGSYHMPSRFGILKLPVAPAAAKGN